jgi:hypothetical protein
MAGGLDGVEIQASTVIASASSILLNPSWVEDALQGKPLSLHHADEANLACTEAPLP